MKNYELGTGVVIDRFGLSSATYEFVGMKFVVTSRRTRPALWFVALALASLLAPSLCAGDAKPLAVLEGKLETTRGDCPVLKLNGHEAALSADTPHLLHTMQDTRLEGREVRLEGIPKADGSFEVHWLYTVHDGKLFKVQYFCATCNIVALEPGLCVCCQQPTVLQEVPSGQSDH
jgi:hypothetical protein